MYLERNATKDTVKSDSGLETMGMIGEGAVEGDGRGPEQQPIPWAESAKKGGGLLTETRPDASYRKRSACSTNVVCHEDLLWLQPLQWLTTNLRKQTTKQLHYRIMAGSAAQGSESKRLTRQWWMP